MDKIKLNIQLFASSTVSAEGWCGQHSSSYDKDWGTVWGYVDGTTAYVRGSLYKSSSGSHYCRLIVYINGSKVDQSSYSNLASKATRWVPSSSGWSSKTITRGANVTFSAKSEAGSDGQDALAGPTATLYWNTVSYNANGGTGSMNSSSGYQGESVSISSCAFSRTGYTFTGWNTASNGTGTSYSVGDTFYFGSTITLYAQWTINSYYLDLNGNIDGTDISNISGYGTVDVYINGSCVSDNTTDYYNALTHGTTYSITDLQVNDNYTCSTSMPISGTMTGYKDARLYFSTKKPWGLYISRINSTNNTIIVTSGASGIIGTYELSCGSIMKSSSGQQTFSGLVPDTNYLFNLHVSNSQGSPADVSATYSTILPDPTITSPSVSSLLPFSCTITATGSINPSRTLQYSFSRDNGSTWTSYQSSNSYNWTGLSEETTYQMKVKVKAIHIGVNSSDTEAISSTLSITTPADQAKIRLRNNNAWTQGRAYIYHNGAWVKAKKLYIYHNGEWKQNINN